MPESPDPVKSTAPGAGAAQTPASVAARPKLAPDTSTEDKDSTPPVPEKTSPWTMIFGALTVILAILAFVFWSQVAARDRTIAGNKNRGEQVEAGAVVMKAQVDAAKADTATVQKRMDEAKAESVQLKATLDKTKADAAEVQILLDKARLVSASFQMQMEEAKVASFKHQGEVEVAKAQVTVAQTQLNKARADTVQLQAQLAESRTLANDLQEKLAKAQKEIALLQRPPPRK